MTEPSAAIRLISKYSSPLLPKVPLISYQDVYILPLALER